MENRTNSPSMATANTTSYEQDSANNGANRSQSNGQGGIMESITSTLGNIHMPDAVKNVQLPQGVKDFGATCARSYSGLTTTQKVIGGAALALGATYWAATSNGWMNKAKNGMTAKIGKKSGNKQA